MANIIHIKCPFDGAVLTVLEQPGLQYKNITCPICKQTFPFRQYKKVVPASDYKDPGTDYTGGRRANREEHTYYNESTTTERTEILILGRLYVKGTRESFQLKPGRNIIGRMASNSRADFKINTGSDRRMSREHILIEAKRIPGKGFVHYISLYKEHTNKTKVLNDILYYGDSIILKNGDTIQLPGVELIFKLPDPEETLK